MKNKRDKVSGDKISQEKISWREAYSLNKRALCLWCREYPMLFVSTGLHSLIAALVPYLTLYFSARLLDELAGTRTLERLGTWQSIQAFCKYGGRIVQNAWGGGAYGFPFPPAGLTGGWMAYAVEQSSLHSAVAARDARNNGAFSLFVHIGRDVCAGP